MNYKLNQEEIEQAVFNYLVDKIGLIIGQEYETEFQFYVENQKVNVEIKISE